MIFGRPHPTASRSGIGINFSNRRRTISRNRGFTLIEILLAIALIGIIASVLAGEAGVFFRAAKRPEPPHRILRKAVLDATYFASQSKETVFLRFEDNKDSKDHGVLFIENASGSALSRYRVFQLPDEDEFTIHDSSFSLIFEAEVPLAGIDGEEGDRNEEFWGSAEIELPRILFHPSGVSTPFIVRLHAGHDDHEEKTYRFDPFSGYLRLKTEEQE
ncbi:MAG: type II secretion system protein [Opitutales bacterium]